MTWVRLDDKELVRATMGLRPLAFRIYFAALMILAEKQNRNWDGSGINLNFARALSLRGDRSTRRGMAELVDHGLCYGAPDNWSLVSPRRFITYPEQRRRRGLSETLRNAVIARDGYICQLCGGMVDPKNLHIDHILPRAAGGTDTLDNLHVTHGRCNLVKGARLVVIDGAA